MKKKIIFLLTYAWMLVLLLSSCSNDTPFVPDDANGKLNLTCEVGDIGTYASYHTLHIGGFPTDGNFTLGTDADWLRIESDTLAADGYVDIWVDENEDMQGRTAQLTLSNIDNPQQSGTIELYQMGLGDNGANAADMNPLSDFRLGWGMNAFLEYQNSNSIKKKIFDLNQLTKLDSEDGFQSVHEVIRGRADFSVETAFSEKEMAATLTKKMEKSFSFLGVKKTMKRFSQVSTNSQADRLYMYARMSKTVATRSIDMGAIEYILEKTPAAQLPFSEEFRTAYNQIVSATNDAQQQKAIVNMLNDFGTHMVIEANIGGMIDYVATFDRSRTQQLEVVAEEQSKRVFGKQSSSSSQTVTSSLKSSISADGAIQIKGGDKQCRTKLQNSIKNLNTWDVIPADLLQDWYSSIVYKADDKNSLDLVDFKLFPIWNLFTDSKISQKVMQQVIAMQEQSNNEFSDKGLGTDCYAISLKNNSFNFKNSSNSDNSLVKVMYVNEVPTLEICEEYVPKIRSDKRVKVFYPIKNGKTNLAQGIFPGDGEGNRPALLSFSDNDVYVAPIEDFGSNDQLSTLYYIHGNLYEKQYGSSTQVPASMEVRDHTFQVKIQIRGLIYWTKTFSYPVVKIGSGYWTRKYITHEMQFGKYSRNGKTFMEYETLEDGLLFANIYETNDAAFMDSNKAIYGQDIDKDTGKQSKWYLPLAGDRKNLTDYVGNNLKCLFKGQQTGFDAQFEGYYGPYDENGNFLGNNERRNKEQKCYIPFKATSTSSKGEALVLTPDYHWQSIETKSSFTYYPVKLFRTSSYQYQSL